MQGQGKGHQVAIRPKKRKKRKKKKKEKKKKKKKKEKKREKKKKRIPPTMACSFSHWISSSSSSRIRWMT